MRKPKAEHTYLFVRSTESSVERATFIRSTDGSAVVFYSESAVVFDDHPDAWRHALAELAKSGFVESREAKRLGPIALDE